MMPWHWCRIWVPAAAAVGGGRLRGVRGVERCWRQHHSEAVGGLRELPERAAAAARRVAARWQGDSPRVVLLRCGLPQCWCCQVLLLLWAAGRVIPVHWRACLRGWGARIHAAAAAQPASCVWLACTPGSSSGGRGGDCRKRRHSCCCSGGGGGSSGRNAIKKANAG